MHGAIENRQCCQIMTECAAGQRGRNGDRYEYCSILRLSVGQPPFLYGRCKSTRQLDRPKRAYPCLRRLPHGTADAVLAGGGKVIGVIPDVKLIQERRHPGLTECIETKDMAERKQKMIELADAYVALPGGPGTLDEISEVICLARLGIENKACVLFDTDGYYQALKKIFEEMVEVGFSEKEDFKRVLVSADLDEIGRFIEQ